MKLHFSFPLCASVAAIMAMGIVEASAQTKPNDNPNTAEGSPSGGITDIIVTAERRASSVQNTPLAITAVTGQSLADRQVQSLADLTDSLPSVNLNPVLGTGRIAIRGVGLDTTQSGSEGRVAFHVDGIYISRPTSTISALYDVDRIEVVRGPQGTLYGRNATAGAINVITRDPGSDFGGYLRASYGNFDAIHTEGAVSIPLSSELAVRFSGQITDRDGWGKNLTTGKDINDAKTQSARAVLQWKPSDGINIRLSGDFHHENDSDYAVRFLGRGGDPNIPPLAFQLGGSVPANLRDTFSGTQQANRRKFYGGALSAEFDLNGATLTSLTGYRHSNTNLLNDADNTQILVVDFLQKEKADQFSQEVRLSGSFDRGQWVGGLYYFNETIRGSNAFSPGTSLISRTAPLPPFIAQGFYSGGRLKTNAYAVFGQIEYEPIDKIKAILGGRYSYEEKSTNEFFFNNFNVPYTNPSIYPVQRTVSRRASFHSFTPRISLEYRPDRDLMLFATYARGFKSGGFSLGQLQPAFDPETLDDYELGLKGDFLDRRLRINLAGFLYKYRNLQVSRVTTVGAQTVNAARAKIYGVEGELTAIPVPQLQFDLTAAYLHARYRDFMTADPARPQLGVLDLAGNELIQSPPYTITLGVQYGIETPFGEVTLRGEGNWIGRVFFSPYNRPEVSQPSYAKYNAFLNMDFSNGMTASLFVRNITDKTTVGYSYVTTSLYGSNIVGALAAPRTYGVELGWKF